jgi:hypothetical protein
MKTFYDLDLLTAPGRVFTPRESTEDLVDAALEPSMTCWQLEDVRAELEENAA